MKRVLMFAPLLLMACTAQPVPVDDGKAKETLAELAKARAEIERLETEAAERVTATVNEAEQRVDEPEPEEEPQSLCGQDYCPCESGQDGQGAEASLCRNLKGGVPVDDNIMAAAAMARDARRQIREFQQQNPDF